MYESFKKYKAILDYLPLLLVGLFFVAEHELEKHAIHTSCQIMATAVVMIIFYLFMIRFKCSRYVALFLAGIIWIIFIYIKKTYLPKL